ncbi:hypothetical protein D3C71_1893360 [compost metagenome]
MHQQHIRVCILQGVEDLRGRQAHVHREQRCAYHGNAEIRLQITVAVPVHHRHGTASAHVQARQGIGQLTDAALEIAVLVTHLAAIADLLVPMQAHGIDQQLLDQQGIGIRRRCGREQVGSGLHFVSH